MNRQTKWKEKKRVEGKCIQCGKENDGSRGIKCPQCADKAKANTKEYYIRNKGDK